MSNLKKYSEIKIGDKAEFTKIFTAKDVVTFSRLSGDNNPVHLDESYAAGTIFKKRIVHGMLVSSLISTVLGTKLPGQGTIYLNQSLNFKKPVFWEDTITAEVEVVEKMEEKNILKLNTQCKNQSDQVVLDGEAVIMLRD